MRQLTNQIALLTVAAVVAAGQTTVTGATVDTQGYDTVTIIATLGTVNAGGSATLKAQGGEASNGSDKAPIDGAVVVASDADDNKKLVIEIHRPTSRFITPTLDRATADSTVTSIDVLLSGASRVPVDQPQIAHDVQLVSPELAS